MIKEFVGLEISVYAMVHFLITCIHLSMVLIIALASNYVFLTQPSIKKFLELYQ